MRPVTHFTLERHPGPYESWPLRSRLIADGVPTRVRLPGYELRWQCESSNAYLLVTDYDCPFEEITCFVLLRKDLRLLSWRWIGAPYSSFVVDAVEWFDERRFVATCGDQRWRFTIRPFGIWYLHPRLGMRSCRDGELRAEPVQASFAR